MSIAPAISFPLERNGPAEKATKPISEPVPKPENTVAKNVSSTYELPQDVVEVHQDSQIKNQVVIQFLDKAKDLILQVPSSEELDVERGIAEEFQQAAKLQASESAAANASEGEKSHGD